MKPNDLVNLGDFAAYIGINRSYLSNLCLYPNSRKAVTETSERRYKGVALPYPTTGSFLSHYKKWLGKDVIAFKLALDAHQTDSAKAL